tara:strand:- start:10829 stop:11485 length:657 start_codon:yes stop_codon:yes gene_type:complete
MWNRRASIVILISGNGSNLQAIIDAISNKQINGYIACVISNNESAYGLERAKAANIKNIIVDHKNFPSREGFDKALLKKIEPFSPDIIVLAGFMRILSQTFIEKFEGKIINIHPSLLPKYPGLNTHDQAIKAKDKIHGVTVHYVNEHLDSGAICAQSILNIKTSNPVELEHEVHMLEYKIYPEVISWIARGDMRINNNKVTFLNKDIENEVIIFEDLR